MTGEATGGLVALMGVVALRLGLTDDHLAYLKPGMRWPLIGAGSILVVLGAVSFVRASRATNDEHDGAAHHADHAHHTPRVAWLLALPAFAVLLIAPGALGAYAASRDTSDVVVAEPASARWAPLPTPRDGAVDLPLGDFVSRSYYDPGESLSGAVVRLLGFVVRDPDVPDGYQLTRFQLACCAADAFAVQIEVHGVDGEPPPDDTWVEITGTWREPPDGAVGVERGAAIDVLSQTVVPTPKNPYG